MAPAHDSATIEHKRLGGNFAYATAEAHLSPRLTPSWPPAPSQWPRPPTSTPPPPSGPSSPAPSPPPTTWPPPSWPRSPSTDRSPSSDPWPPTPLTSSPSTRPAPTPTPVWPPTPGSPPPQLWPSPPPQWLPSLPQLPPSVPSTVVPSTVVLSVDTVSAPVSTVPVSTVPDSDSPTADSLPPPPPWPVMLSLPSTKKDTSQKESHATSIKVQDTRLNDDDDNAVQSQLAQRQPRKLFKTQRIQEAMSFAKTPVRHHELNQIHYNRLFRFLIS